MSIVSMNDSTAFSDNLPESADELQAVVSAERRQLKRSLDQLGTAVRDKVNVRSRLRENPYITVGAALTAGVVLGVLSKKATRDEDSDRSPAHRSGKRKTGSSRNGTGTFGHMASTIAALVGQRLAGVAEDSVRNALAHWNDDKTPSPPAPRGI